MKITLKCSMLLAALLAITAPHFMLGVLVSAMNLPLTPRILIFCAGFALTLNVKRLLRLVRRTSVNASKGNQHAYHGVPLDNFASYLFSRRAFTTAAMNDLGLAQRKWAKIADELEHHGILTRGENNSRVLAEIDRETLVRQLRDGFPLVFDPVGKTWVERRGSFDQWVLQKERREEKEKDSAEKLERKTERMRANIAKMREEQNSFQSVMALMGA